MAYSSELHFFLFWFPHSLAITYYFSTVERFSKGLYLRNETMICGLRRFSNRALINGNFKYIIEILDEMHLDQTQAVKVTKRQIPVKWYKIILGTQCTDQIKPDKHLTFCLCTTKKMFIHLKNPKLTPFQMLVLIYHCWCVVRENRLNL